MTIYALSSGPGVSGVAVIRISGPETAKVIKKITGQAHIEPMNKTSDRKIDTVGYGGASFSYDSLDTYIDFKSGSNTSIQFRNFSGSKGSWQGEVGIKGSSAKHGKIGGGAIWEILKSHGIKSFNPNDNQQFYIDCGIESKKISIAEKIYELLTKFPAADYNKTEHPTSSLYEEYKRLGKITDGGGKLDGTTEQIRQEYVKILSSIHFKDAEVVVLAGQGNLDDEYKVGLPAVKAAFPELDFE